MYSSRTTNQHERGNILFLILIAVALFAALTFVVAQSSRSGGGDASREKARLATSEIQNHATAVQTAVARLLLGGCDVSAISFESANDTLHANPAAPANKRCHVFDPAGGGVAAKKADSNWTTMPTYIYASSAALTGIGTTCTGANCADLVMLLRGVNQALCEQFNTANGWKIAFGNLPTDTQAGCPYNGTFDCSGNGTVTVAFTAPLLNAKNSVCYIDSVYGPTISHVVLER